MWHLPWGAKARLRTHTHTHKVKERQQHTLGGERSGKEMRGTVAVKGQTAPDDTTDPERTGLATCGRCAICVVMLHVNQWFAIICCFEYYFWWYKNRVLIISFNFHTALLITPPEPLTGWLRLVYKHEMLFPLSVITPNGHGFTVDLIFQSLTQHSQLNNTRNIRPSLKLQWYERKRPKMSPSSFAKRRSQWLYNSDKDLWKHFPLCFFFLMHLHCQSLL